MSQDDYDDMYEGGGGELEPLDVAWDVEKVFSDDGVLAQKFDGYQKRKSQIQLSKAIELQLEKGGHLVAEAPTGCHVRGQKILMFDGRVKLVEDVETGDVLMGPNSQPKTVLSIIRGRGSMVDIVPAKGDTWRVNMGHVLSLQRTRTKTGNGDRSSVDCLDFEIVDVSVSDYLGWSKTRKHIYKLFRSPAEFDNKFKLPIDPYHLGILLGDGHIRDDRVSVCTMDDEVVAELEDLAKRFSVRLVKKPKDGCKASDYGLVLPVNHGRKRNPLLSALRDLGLVGKLAGDKFVPDMYLRSRSNFRAEILAGLIDTDGFLSRGCFDYISKSKRLAEDVVFLSRSLGFAAYMKQCEKGYNAFSGIYYRVTISGDLSIIPVRVQRRIPAERRQKKNVLRIGFKVVETGEVDDFFGFTLSGDGRYLLGDFTVTHNSGKSLAYLVPTIRHCVTSGTRAIVCTANIALQEQLFKKDLPLLKEILPTEFKFALVKGRNNYFCVRGREKLKEEYAQGSFGKDFGKAENPDDMDIEQFYSRMPSELVQLCEWSKKTETGDRSELPMEPSDEAWRQVSVTAEDCFGSACPYREQCFAERARKSLRDTHIIVANYHFLMAAVSVRMDVGKDVVLPEFDTLVCDEAHKVAEVARSFFGWNISIPRLNRIFTQLRKRTRQAQKDLSDIDLAEAERQADQLDAYIHDLEAQMKGFFGQNQGAARIKFAGQIRTARLSSLMEKVKEMFRLLGRQLNRDAKAECQKMAESAGKLRTELRDLDELEDANGVYYMERFGLLGGIRICKRLKDVSQMLWDEVYQRTKTTVATSATMAIDGDCDYVKKEIGMFQSQDLVVESPFDFQDQGLLILSDRAPDPQDRERYGENVKKIFRVIVDQAEGRTLGLFTSYKILREVAEYLREHEDRYQILVQGDRPRMELVRLFKEDVHSILLGTESFWAGVDVPGESLSCLVIDKIPFPSPGDPVLEAIQEEYGGFGPSFFKVSIPRAVLQLRQGAGRLIRSVNDRGVMLVLDRRLVTKGYGSTFVKSLPPMRRASTFKGGEIRDWLKRS